MSYNTLPCWQRDDEVRLVQDVCPPYDDQNRKICHLNGCGDIISAVFTTQYLPVLVTFTGTFTVAFVVGLIFILQITHNFYGNSLRDDWTQVTYKIFGFFIIVILSLLLDKEIEKEAKNVHK